MATSIEPPVSGDVCEEDHCPPRVLGLKRSQVTVPWTEDTTVRRVTYRLKHPVGSRDALVAKVANVLKGGTYEADFHQVARIENAPGRLLIDMKDHSSAGKRTPSLTVEFLVSPILAGTSAEQVALRWEIRAEALTTLEGWDAQHPADTSWLRGKRARLTLLVVEAETLLPAEVPLTVMLGGYLEWGSRVGYIRSKVEGVKVVARAANFDTIAISFSSIHNRECQRITSMGPWLGPHKIAERVLRVDVARCWGLMHQLPNGRATSYS